METRAAGYLRESAAMISQEPDADVIERLCKELAASRTERDRLLSENAEQARRIAEIELERAAVKISYYEHPVTGEVLVMPNRDRVVATEKERHDLQLRVVTLEAERDALEVRLKAMEQQEPVGWHCKVETPRGYMAMAGLDREHVYRELGIADLAADATVTWSPIYLAPGGKP